MDKEQKSASMQSQASILMGATFAVRILGFLYRVWLTNKILGNKGMGYNAAAYYIYTFVLLFSSAGLPSAISKMVSERIALKQYKESHMIFKTALVLATIFGLAGFLLLALFSKFLSAHSVPEGYYSLIALSPTILIAAISAVFRGYFQGMRNMVPTAISQVVEQLFNAIFSVLFAYIMVKGGLDLGAAGSSIGTGIGAAAGVLVIFGMYQHLSKHIKNRINSRKNIQESFAAPIALAKELLTIAWPIIIGMAVLSLSNLVDIFLVSNRLAASGAFTKDQIDNMYGLLTNKYMTLTTMPVSISTAVAIVVIPNIARSMKLHDLTDIRNKINEGLRLSMLLSIPAAIGLTVLGDPAIRMIYASVPDGGILMEFGSISIIFLAITQTVTGMLQGIGKVKIPVLGALASVIVKIIFNYILIAIPSINVIGAVISTTLCYLVAGAIDIYFLWKFTGTRFDISGAFIKPLGASLIMGMFCYVSYNVLHYVFKSNTFSVLLAIVLGIGLYFVILVAVGGVDARFTKRIPILRKLAQKIDGILK